LRLPWRDWTFVDIPEKSFVREFRVSHDDYPDLVELHRALDAWTSENCTGMVVRFWQEADHFGSDVLRVYFAKPEDAFAYRMRWS
jgi:hypothetical protein